MKNNTFIVLSTINASSGVFTPENRFKQTLTTLDSIHNKVPGAKIYFLDNSINPLEYNKEKEIRNRVDIFDTIEHNIFTRMIDGSCGFGEAYMMPIALEKLKYHGILGDRVFKLSGRYFLQPSFDISKYDIPELFGKYTFKINQWDVSKDNFRVHREIVTYFETRLWSFCSSLFNEYKMLLPKIFISMFSIQNWEKVHYMLIPHDKVVEIPIAHVEGLTAATGIIKIE